MLDDQLMLELTSRSRTSVLSMIYTINQEFPNTQQNEKKNPQLLSLPTPPPFNFTLIF